jgi:hypothetical protein
VGSGSVGLAVARQLPPGGPLFAASKHHEMLRRQENSEVTLQQAYNQMFLRRSQTLVADDRLTTWNRAPRSDMLRCVRPRRSTSWVTHTRTWEALVSWLPRAFPSAVNGGCDVKPQGEAGG